MIKTTKCNKESSTLRDKIYHKALTLNEDLMPFDVVEFIEDENLSDWKEKLNLLIDVYTSCGFDIDVEYTKEMYEYYFD